ncbi:MAG: metalloregulator ArsR/SmtB family transcription factor [Candidatus Bathyarchaeota archaeon]|jgi:DNA-binding transcriptional ArsR family regulator
MKYNLSKTCHLFFSTLSTPSRLGILEALEESPRNVSQLVNSLNQEQSMISHNLKSLARCGFVFVEKKGRERVYFLNREIMEPMFKLIDKHMKKYCPENKECLG